MRASDLSDEKLLPDRHMLPRGLYWMTRRLEKRIFLDIPKVKGDFFSSGLMWVSNATDVRCPFEFLIILKHCSSLLSCFAWKFHLKLLYDNLRASATFVLQQPRQQPFCCNSYLSITNHQSCFRLVYRQRS